MSDRSNAPDKSGTEADSTLMGPVRPDERLPFVDVLRGLALLGILVENLAPYAGYSYDLRTVSDPLARIASALVQFLFEAKSYSLLALLFGWGIAATAHRARLRGIRFIPLYLRRLLALLILGVLHGALIWFGDILILYAFLGLLLIPLLIWRRLSVRWILAAAAGAFALSIVLAAPGGALDAVRAWYDQATSWLRYSTYPESLYRTGTYAQVTRRRIQDLLEANSWLLYYAGNVMGMLLLGLYIGQRRLFEQAWQQPWGKANIARKTLAFGLLIGVPLNVFYVATGLWPHLAPDRYARLVRVGVRTIGAPALVLLYVSAAILFLSSAGRRARWRRLAVVAHVGRMSLSSYLLQSLVCTWVFYGYGLGLYGQVGPLFGLIVAVVLYWGQVRFCEWWFDRFQFGPMEWLWRSFTYWRRQPLRRGETAGGARPLLRWTKTVKICVLVLAAVVCLGAFGLILWKSPLPVPPDRRQLVERGTRVPASVPTRAQATSLQQPEHETESFVVVTPQVEPAIYRPSAIAATGDLAALARAFDVQDALAQIDTLTGAPYLGRYPGSYGGRAAGDYLAEQFAAYGLQPAGQDGTFFQAFPVEYVTLAAVPRLAVEFADGTIHDHYQLYRDYSVILREYSGEGTVAGQVIWANDCAHKDFDLLDAVGKVVLCRDGPVLQAQRNALEHGATGLLLLADPEQRPPDMGSTRREPWTPEPIVTLRIYPALAQALLAGEYTLADLSSRFAPFALTTRVHLDLDTTGPESCPSRGAGTAGCTGRNILGVLPGRDPRYADQVIVLGAHYDHVGESPDGTVWPGANDDASGVAVLLAIAQSWHEQGYVPRRTVLFAAWDAEEMGLRGSGYYVQHPSYPLESTVAKIQLDMVGAGADTLQIDGSGELGAWMSEIAADFYADVAQTDHLGGSDHVPFQQAGIPATALTWAQGEGSPPHYHRPMDIPSIIDPAKLETAGQVAAGSLLALAEGEPAIRDLVSRRVEAIRQGDVDAFLSTSTAERQVADLYWLRDLQALGATDVDMQIDRLRVLGRTATARVSLVSERSQENGEGDTRVAAGSMTVLFRHDGAGWQWVGPDLVQNEGVDRQPDELPRFSTAYQPGVPEPAGLAQEAEERYAQINALLGLDGPGGRLWLYPNDDALRMDTALSLPKDQSAWIGFRIVKSTNTPHTTATNSLTTILCQLALAEHGIDRNAAPWLWDGLPHLVGEHMSGKVSSFPGELQKQDLLSSTERDVQEVQESDAALAWAAVEYLHMQVGWQGLGEFITALGQTCQGGEPDKLQEGAPVHCQAQDAQFTALSTALGIDGRAFEGQWRQYWHDRLAAAQADLDAVLTARAQAVLSGDQRAFLDTVDPQVPGLMEEERYWFADLAEHPVDYFEPSGTLLSFQEDGSILARVTIQYRLQQGQDRRSPASIPLTIQFTPTPTGYRWAGHPFEKLSGEHVQILYHSLDDAARPLAETLLPDIERSYLQAANELGIERPEVLTVKLYDSGPSFRTSIALSFPAAEWLSAWTGGEGTVKALLPVVGLQDELAVQAARCLLNQMGVRSEWLLKGTSLYLAGTARADTFHSLAEVLEASLDGALADLEALAPDHRIEEPAQFHRSRAQALDTINYLAATQPPGTLLRVLRAHSRGMSVDEALRQEIGRSWAEFEVEWSQSLARGHARPEWIEIARTFDPELAARHVEHLADPQLAGRQAGSSGDGQAIAYISAQFAELGLTPVATYTTSGVDPFLQRFPISYTTLSSSPSLIVSRPEAQTNQSMTYRQHFMTVFDPASKGTTVSGQLVWVRDSTSDDMDLDGKIVLCQPAESLQSQVEWAIQRGASGLLLIGKKASQRSMLAKHPLPATFTIEPSIPVLELTRQGTDLLLEIAGMTREDLATSLPALHMGCEVALDIPLDAPQTVETANVLGLLPGSDPRLSQELIIVGAHHDHVGNDPRVHYAGSNDNASGVGVLIEIARLWQEAGYRPQRSVLFAAWGAQEPGELGARYYVEHPAYPLTDTIAVLELDSVGGGRGYFLEAQSDPVREGLLRFTLQAAEEWVDGRLSLTRPSRRGDHSVFRERGIPAMLLTWRESSEDNLPVELADPVEPYRLGVTGKMTSLALMALAQ